MKFSSLFLVGMLVAALVVMAAPVAKADGVIDPRIIINAGGDPACGGAGQPACFGGGILTTVFNGVDESADFVYTGTDPLTSLTLDLTNVPFGAPLSCESDVFVSCEITLIDPVFTEAGLFFTVQVLFADTVNGNPVDVPSPCVNPFTQGAICAGSIVQGELIHEIIQTPEPSSLALMAIGLIPILGIGRKRWMAIKSS